MSATLASLRDQRGDLLQLLQELVRIASPTCQEGALGHFVESKLREIGMSTFTDAIGDVTGLAASSSESSYLLLSTHLDHAEPGDMPDAFGGKLMDGAAFGVPGQVVYGRGVNGQKGSLAAMLFAAKAVLESGIPLRRGFAISAGVMEECGGHLSPRYLMERDRLPVFAVVCGEHTNLAPVNAQRGMIHIQLRIRGQGAHAAAPEGSSSALMGTARVILALEKLGPTLPNDPVLGRALVSLNKLAVNPNVVNAIPDRVDAVVDVRHPASVPQEAITAAVEQCIGEAVATQAGLTHTAGIERQRVKSTTGVEEWSDDCMFPFYTPPDAPLTLALCESIRQICGASPAPELWSISSEGGYFSTVSKLPVVAFGPGQDRFTHNQCEHVRADDVVTTALVYASLILRMCA